jgi:diguanylate cyclase (GGDEF)-like protein
MSLLGSRKVHLVGWWIGLPALVACVLWSAWHTTGTFTESRIATLVATEILETERAAEALGRIIENRFAFLRGVPALLAEEDTVGRAIVTGSDSKSSATSRRFARAARELGLNAVWLMDRNGVGIAASNFDHRNSLVGSPFGDQSYFQVAIRGERSQQYTIGHRDLVPALFFSAPVRAEPGILGVVAIKIDMHALSEWVSGTDSFVTDENGVVILATDNRLENHAMQSSGVYTLPAAARTALYRRTDFAELAIAPAGDRHHPRLIRFGNEPMPYVVARAQVPSTMLTAHTLSRMNQIERMRVDRLSAFYLFSFGGLASAALIIGVILHVQRGNFHRATLSAANAKLSILNERLEHEASTDPLTRCANRRRFTEALEIELARAKRHGVALSVLVADLDYFKRVNDGYGHAAGDEALRHFAAITTQSIRSADLLARLGGEEFVVLLPHTDQAGALVLADRIRAALEATPLSFGDTSIGMTVSIGVATLNSTHATIDSLLQSADIALYTAKERGRNRVESATIPVAA